MPILEQLQNHFPSYVWKHVLSMLVGLMLLREAKTLTALQYHESLPTLSRTLNTYPCFWTKALYFHKKMSYA